MSIVDPFIGEIQIWGGAGPHPPEGWMFCEGQSLDVDDKNKPDIRGLLAVIGYRYGGSSSNDFRLPDLRRQAHQKLKRARYIISLIGVFPR